MFLIKNAVAAGAMGLGTLGLGALGLGGVNGQDKGGIVAPVSIGVSVDQIKDSKEFFKLLDATVKKYGGLPGLDAPEINAKNVTTAETAFKWILNPEGGIQPSGKGIPNRFKANDKAHTLRLISRTASGIAGYYKDLRTPMGNENASKYGNIAQAYLEGAREVAQLNK